MAMMPPAIVLIVCKVAMLPAPDAAAEHNSHYTGHQNLEWATEHSKMVCRRQEVQMVDQAEMMGADPQPFNQQRCQQSGIMLGAQWNMSHRGSRYRFWRVACPVPIIDTRTGKVLAWKMPECGHRDTVVCETDVEL